MWWMTAVRARGIGFIAASAALAIGLSALPAAAATWTITPGGAVAMTGTNVKAKDSHSGSTITCTSLGLDGTMEKGSGLSGTRVASLDRGTATGCTVSTISLTVRPEDLPWRINLLSYNSGTVRGTISHMEIAVTAPGCSFVIDGTTGGASDGKVDFSYSDSTGKLTITGGNLHVWDVSGCLGLVNNGDPIGITGTFTLTPRQKITSP
jgi:hypothetical protein